jgi:prepilin-type N-terminal cleavage/methylation domain-containing protein
MRRNKSFTLIEVILAIAIFTLCIGGSFILIQQTIISVSLANSKLVAYYLAQEGIEMVRNIRDNNWLKQRINPLVAWKDGLSVGAWEADYNDAALANYLDPGRNLYVDKTNGFYFYPDVPLPDHLKTNFKRKITISQGTTTDDLYIESKVEWTERTRTHNVKLYEHLFNWYGY